MSSGNGEQDNAARDAFDPKALVSYYEQSMYDPLIREYMGHGDFHNFGYWDTETRSHEAASEDLMEALLDLVPCKQGKILDVACGKGATTRYLLKYYAAQDVTGINVSDKQLETAKQNAPGCTFLWMDASDLRFPAGSFDTVICVEAAFHFDTREVFLREAHRVLRQDGWLVLSDILVTREAERRRIGRTERNYVADPEAYRALLERTGFTRIRVIDATVPCWHGLYHSVVTFGHQKFLAKEIELAELERLLDPTYHRVPDLTYYLMAAAQKG